MGKNRWKQDIITPVTQGGQPRWANDLINPDGSPVTAPPDESTMLEWLKQNAATPGGIGGSITGGLIGSKFGPVGTFVGSVAGGAIGSAGGSVASDVMTERDIDITKALTEAGMSVGIDLTTFGLGRYIGKPLWNFAKDSLSKGVPAEQVVKQLAEGAIEAKGKMDVDVVQSQHILSKEGLSLTPFQLGIASKWDIAKELLGRTGIVSKNIFDSKAIRIKEVIQKRLEKITGEGGNLGLSNDVLGEHIYKTLAAGKKALNDSYGQELDNISTLVVGKKFNLDILRKAIDSHTMSPKNVDDVGRSTIEKEAQDVIKDLKDGIGEGSVSTGRYLMQFEKRLNDQINKAAGNLDNPKLEMDLIEFKKSLQGTITEQMNKFGGEAGTKYRNLQNFFSVHQGNLLPEVNQNIIKTAKGKALYTSIGRMFNSTGKVTQVEKLLKSIDESYALMPKEDIANLTYKNADEVKNIIRESYVREVFPELGATGFKVSDFQKIGKQLKNKTEAKRIKAIMGPKFGAFRRTVNLMESASKKPASGMALLFLRTKEYAAGAGIATGIGTGAIEATTGLGAAATIFGIPSFMARAATSPKYVNKLIKIDQLATKGGKNLKKAGIMLTATGNDLIDELYAENMGDENFIQQLKDYKVLPSDDDDIN